MDKVSNKQKHTTLNYRLKQKVNAVQYGLAEYGDSPYVLKDGFVGNGTDWIEKLIEQEIVKPVFKTEDYWYLSVVSENGTLFASPDDWIVQYDNGRLDVMGNDKFKEMFEPLN